MKLVVWIAFGFLTGLVANALNTHFLFNTVTILAIFTVMGIVFGESEQLLRPQ